MDEKLAVTAVILDFAAERTVFTWKGQTIVPLALIEGEPLVQRTLRQLEDARVARIIVVHASDEVRKVAEGSHMGAAEIFVVDDLDSADHLKAVLASSEPHSRVAVFIVAANVAFADGVIKDFISAQTSHPCRRRRVLIEAPSHGGKKAALPTSQPTLSYVGEAMSPSLVGCVRATAGSLMERGELLDRHDASADETAIAPGGTVKVIRDALDLEIANFLFSPAEARYHRVSKGSGGYWSRPIAEHLLLCNSFFPPARFFDRLADRLRDVLTFYPSGQEHLARLVALMTGQAAEHIVVGSGVTDIIQALYAVIEPRISIPTPTFDMLQIALPPERVSCFELPEPFFDLDVDKFGAFSLERQATAAVVVNPNNPSGRLAKVGDLRRLASTLESVNSGLIVDESFIDFPRDGLRQSFEPYVAQHPNVIILKSLGKVWGLGGIRLGYMLSANTELVSRVRQRLPLWNVDGVAEYALWIIPEFRADLQDSLELIRAAREQLEASLRELSDFAIVPSSTNFVFCKLPASWPSGSALKRWLVIYHNVLIRECAYQTMRDADRYIRLSVRSLAENARLIDALQKATKVSWP
ncbi:aminotransferase class I/II-fold pyridoxal phosphate-dependent enzyme [Bradyrhizobium sp. DN5]|uniref:aminotransferase class I/II-fold pyridoxal phosphate-dependent enzyme n=1 Tax=Bradyrhizobium sp. DN5 TaxID=3056950 RepID=UPI0035234742